MRQSVVTKAKSNSLVCVIEDDAAVRESLAAVVEALDCRVACFATAEEFLTRSEDADPQMLIVDVRLPGMSGLELLARMAAGPVTPPCIVMTGHADAQELQLDFWPNEITILPKPCQPERVMDMIVRARTA